MSNIHTINYDQNNREPDQNAWIQGNVINQGNSVNPPPNNNNPRNFGGGQSLDGRRAPNPWANQNVQPRVEHNAGQAEAQIHGVRVEHPQPGNNNVDDEPELMRQYNGHMFDAFWTDNLPPHPPPGFLEMCFISGGCSCCVGPCCNDVRHNDYKRLFMTFTIWTMIVDLIMLIIEYATGGGIDFSNFEPRKGSEALINLGAKYYPLIYCNYHVFRYFTPIVLHAGLWHFGSNMLFTYWIMLPREVYWGLIRTAVMYLVSGVGGCVLSIGMYPWASSVGASGALMGIFGGYLVDIARMWKRMDTQQKIRHAIFIGIYFVIMIIIGFIPGMNIDNGAHLGGLLTGIFLGMILLQKNLYFRIAGGVLLACLWIIPTVLIYTLRPVSC